MKSMRRAAYALALLGALSRSAGQPAGQAPEAGRVAERWTPSEDDKLFTSLYPKLMLGEAMTADERAIWDARADRALRDVVHTPAKWVVDTPLAVELVAPWWLLPIDAQYTLRVVPDFAGGTAAELALPHPIAKGWESDAFWSDGFLEIGTPPGPDIWFNVQLVDSGRPGPRNVVKETRVHRHVDQVEHFHQLARALDGDELAAELKRGLSARRGPEGSLFLALPRVLGADGRVDVGVRLLVRLEGEPIASALVRNRRRDNPMEAFVDPKDRGNPLMFPVRLQPIGRAVLDWAEVDPGRCTIEIDGAPEMALRNAGCAAYWSGTVTVPLAAVLMEASVDR